MRNDFASQQEVALWIAHGNKVRFITSEVVGFKDGVLWNFSKNQKSDYSFCAPSQWQKHTPPRLIRVNGVEVPAPLESLDGFETVYIIKRAEAMLKFEVVE